jgi:hypothetical protein
VYGGYFEVTFDNISIPKLTELTGTIFAVADTTPDVVVSTSPEPMLLGHTTTAAVQYGGLGDLNVVLDWGDTEESTFDLPGGLGSFDATHIYQTAGVYIVTATITDSRGYITSDTFQYAVVYSPEGGFVTGGGWIDSPEGAIQPEPGSDLIDATGRGTFGFVSRYNRGANIPIGNTEFQFWAGNLNFRSTAYEWLVVAGARAQYKGWGNINGHDGYRFMLTAIDGALLGGGRRPDQFRIKIWNEVTGVVVYDNQRGSDDNVELDQARTVIGGGNIVVHNPPPEPR